LVTQIQKLSGQPSKKFRVYPRLNTGINITGKLCVSDILLVQKKLRIKSDAQKKSPGIAGAFLLRKYG
jgi:hypothetical protein